jgi:hypothetical protein
MKSAALLLSLVACAGPLQAAKWPALTREVWALKNDPALVAKGAVILERKLDFQPAWFDQTLRVRILGPAGLAAAEFRDLPANVLSLEGQVTFPDGKVVPFKRDGFQNRKVVSATDGVTQEQVAVAPGVTTDCVMEVTWREHTDLGQALRNGKTPGGRGNLPERFGSFWLSSLGAAYPTQSVVVQRAKEFYWSMVFSATAGFDAVEGSTAMGTTFTFRNLPGFPPAPYASEMIRPVPKVVIARPIASVAYLQTKVPALAYWDKVAELFYKDWYQLFLSKGEAYRSWSLALREGLTGGPRARAKAIAERLCLRTVNLDQLRFGEKTDALARHGVDEGKLAMGGSRFYDPGDSNISHSDNAIDATASGGDITIKYTMDDTRVSAFNYMAKTGFVDNKGVTRLLYHLLADEGIPFKVALVADRNRWMVNPEMRTPFQFTANLLLVEEPGQPALWLDPTNRMLPVGALAPEYQSTKAVVLDRATWKAEVRDLKVEPATASTRTTTFQVDATGTEAKIHLEASLTGAPAFLARNVLGPLPPDKRQAWLKTSLDKAGLTVARTEVADVLELGKPLGLSADASQPLAPGPALTIRLFPGLDSALYLPDPLPEQRLDPILLPYLCTQEATSTVKVPKGHLLAKPVATSRSTPWGSVLLEVHQDPASGDLLARMRVSTLVVYNYATGYPSLVEYLKLARAAFKAEATLEKGP